VGAIAAWGEIEVYAAGFRAEYASIIALAHQPSGPPNPPARLREAARRYGVRLVQLADLEAEAREFALPLPDKLLPKRRVFRPDPVSMQPALRVEPHSLGGEIRSSLSG
jgi:hypothetical protein